MSTGVGQRGRIRAASLSASFVPSAAASGSITITSTATNGALSIPVNRYWHAGRAHREPAEHQSWQHSGEWKRFCVCHLVEYGNRAGLDFGKQREWDGIQHGESCSSDTESRPECGLWRHLFAQNGDDRRWQPIDFQQCPGIAAPDRVERHGHSGAVAATATATDFGQPIERQFWKCSFGEQRFGTGHANKWWHLDTDFLADQRCG